MNGVITLLTSLIFNFHTEKPQVFGKGFCNFNSSGILKVFLAVWICVCKPIEKKTVTVDTDLTVNVYKIRKLLNKTAEVTAQLLYGNYVVKFSFSTVFNLQMKKENLYPQPGSKTDTGLLTKQLIPSIILYIYLQILSRYCQ